MADAPSSGAHAGGSSDRALLARLCAGDAAAFDALVRRYWAPLVAYVQPVVEDRQASEDIVQDLWAAGSDTLFRIDPESRAVTFATRLRDAPTGCYVEWIDVIGDGRRLLIGGNRRVPAGPVASASVGDVLEFDVERLVAERVARFPGWSVHGVRRSGDVVIQAWGEAELWVAGVERAQVPTFPPRPAGARDWR